MIFSFLQCKICAPEKSGASQRFGAPERAQACDLEMNLQVLSIYEFLVDLTQLELTKGKERVKMLRFTLKARERL